MPVSSCWYIKNRVLYLRQWGRLTLAEAVATDSEIARHSYLFPEMVHGIVDQRDIETLDANEQILRETFARLVKPTLGWVAVVGQQENLLVSSCIMAKAQQMQYSHFDTPESALDFLKLVDPSLNNLPIIPL
jgi:hypothetical protein